jgi:hypothetical protein
MVMGQILDGVLPLTKLEVSGLHEDPGTMLASPLTVSVYIRHTNHHRVGCLARSWGTAIPAHVSDYDSAVSKAKLRPVVIANPHALDKPKSRAQPLDSLPHIRIDEHRDDR